MPKIIKKKPAKARPAQEDEVKHAALHALDAVKQKQKQVITIVSAILAVAILVVAFKFYSSSQNEKAYALEKEAYNIYYNTRSDKTTPEMERWKKALELFKKSVDVKATPTALYYLGNCYYNLNDHENAIKQYSLFIDKFGGNYQIVPLVYEKLASAYFKTGKSDKALETLGNLAKVNQGIFRDTALMTEARYYESTGNAEKAKERYKTVATEFPNSPWGAEANSKIAVNTQAAPKVEIQQQPPAAGPVKK
ncbi:MAG: tetratricopeptide repeat protein [Nitrospirae bacterium]|nr:tetratricopeptide repeat protein [Nitrospirota bacterium]